MLRPAGPGICKGKSTGDDGNDPKPGSCCSLRIANIVSYGFSYSRLRKRQRLAAVFIRSLEPAILKHDTWKPESL